MKINRHFVPLILYLLNCWFPRWFRWKRICLQWRRQGFDPWVGNMSWRRKRQPIPVFLPEENPWTKEPDGLQSKGSQRIGHDWVTTHWQRPWCWEGLGAGGEGDDRGWDGWMASRTQWTRVWVNSGSWWWTGRPGVLRFMGSQRVGHDWATELNWVTSSTPLLIYCVSLGKTLPLPGS